MGGSPRTGTAPQNNQTQTYQDVTGAYMLGKIKKIPGQPLWMVFRFEGETDWCLLCGKYASTSHLDSDKHVKRTTDVGYYLKEWKYPFQDWLLQEPTQSGYEEL